MSDPLVDLLERCAVLVRGDRTGSGFFVAPGRVLTCAHVIGRDRAVGSGGVRVVWGGSVDDEATVVGIWPAADDDVAILAVSFTGHPCVRLGTGMTLDHDVYAYGHPDYGAGPQGDGVTGRLESLTRLPEAGADRRLLKFKGAEVVHGFSGGPLLDRTAGEVIGIVTETRGIGSGLGGWAIPIGFVFACCPGLQAEHDAFHTADREWERRRSMLEAQRRAGLSGLDVGLPAATPIGNFLAHYLGSPEAPEPFGGRERDLRRLGRWLEEDRAAPYLLLAAPAGRGKSALLVRWYDELSRQRGNEGPALELVFVPVSIRYELNAEAAVFGALAARLIRLHGGPPPPPGATGEELRDRVSSLLLRPPPEGKRLLILLDGVDEAAGWDVGPALFPHTPAAGVRLVLSARLTERRPTPESWLERLGWRPPAQAEVMDLEPLDRAGVRDVLERMGAPLDELARQREIVDELERLTRGDPLLLGLYAKDLWGRGEEASRLQAAQLSRLDPGIEGYFDRWWRDQEAHWGERLADQKKAVQIVFNVLATALGPLPRRDLLRLVRGISDFTGDALDDALATLARFVAREPARQTYVLAHPRFAQYRYDKLAADGDEEAYERLFLDWGRETLALVEKEDDFSKVSSYIVQRYGAHLERARRPAAERLGLVSAAWRRAWESHSDEHDGYLSDVERTWRAAGEADRKSVAAGEPAPFVADEIRCALVTAEAHGSIELTDPALLAVLAAQGVWSVGRCLSFAFGLEGREAQATALAALAPSLEGRHLAPLIAAVDRLFDPVFPDSCAPLITALAVRLAELGDTARALELARARPGFARGHALVHLVPHLPPQERTAALGEALEDARDEEDVLLSDWLLRLLAWQVDPRLLEEGGHRDPGYRDRLIELLDLKQVTKGHQAWRLGYAAPWLEDSERRRWQREAVDHLLSRASQNSSPIFQKTDIVDLARALDPDLAEEVLTRCIDQFPDGYGGYVAYTLLALFPRLSEARREEVAPRLLAAAPQAARLHGMDDCRDFFARLAEAGFGDPALQVIADQPAEDWHLHLLIQAVLPFLDERQTRICLGLAERCRAETRARARSAALGRLASFGREQAREALSFCHQRAAQGDEEAAALALLAPCGRDGFLALIDIEDQHLRLAAMVQAAAFLGQLDAELFALALSSFGHSPKSVLAVEAIGCLAPFLAPEAATEERVIRAVQLPVLGVGHPQKGFHLLPYFRRLAAVGRGREGLAIGHRLASATFTFPLFCAITGLAEVLEGEDLRSALTAAEEIEEPTEKILALLALSPRTREDRQEILLRRASEYLADFDIQFTGVQSDRIALVLGALPEPVRRRVLPVVATGELLGASGHLAADAQVSFLPFLPQDQVEKFRADPPRHGSGTDQSRLRAALAARLTALGSAKEGLEMCRTSSGQQLIDGLTGTLATLPPDLWPSLVEPAFQLPGYKRVRLSPALAARWKDLSPSQLLAFFQAWLRQASRTSRSELAYDLVLLTWPLHRLGGERAAARALEILKQAG